MFLHLTQEVSLDIFLKLLQVKMKITGYGRAKKEEVQRKIQYLLDLKKSNKKITKARDDAIDALGVALCYAKIKKLTS